MLRAEAAVRARNSKQPNNKIAILVKATEPTDYGPDTKWSDSVTAVTASPVGKQAAALRLRCDRLGARAHALTPVTLALSVTLYAAGCDSVDDHGSSGTGLTCGRHGLGDLLCPRPRSIPTGQDRRRDRAAIR